jgi:hypothetical protein
MRTCSTPDHVVALFTQTVPVLNAEGGNDHVIQGIDANRITSGRLTELAPVGTIDPTSFLYDLVLSTRLHFSMTRHATPPLLGRG